MHYRRDINKRIISASLMICITTLISACGNVRESGLENVVPEYIFTYADNQPEDYPTTQGAEYFAQLVNEETDGRIRIDVRAGGEMGTEDAVVKQVEYGGVDFARVSIATLSDYSDEGLVLMMPYIYDSSEQMWEILGGDIGREVMASYDGTGIAALSWYDAGVRNFYTRQEIHSIEDMRGMTIRVQKSDIMSDMIRAIGAVPLYIDYQDVYSAIETGTVDGAENNWPSYRSMGHDQVAGYMLLDEHTRIPELQIMSQTTRDRLSDEDIAIIDRCAAESAEYERRLWQEYEKTAREQALAAGCIEISLSEPDKDAFREAVKPLYMKYCSRHMDMLYRIINWNKEEEKE